MSSSTPELKPFILKTIFFLIHIVGNVYILVLQRIEFTIQLSGLPAQAYSLVYLPNLGLLSDVQVYPSWGLR